MSIQLLPFFSLLFLAQTAYSPVKHRKCGDWWVWLGKNWDRAVYSYNVHENREERRKKSFFFSFVFLKRLCLLSRSILCLYYFLCACNCSGLSISDCVIEWERATHTYTDTDAATGRCRRYVLHHFICKFLCSYCQRHRRGVVVVVVVADADNERNAASYTRRVCAVGSAYLKLQQQQAACLRINVQIVIVNMLDWPLILIIANLNLI